MPEISAETPLTGGCLCGAVRITVTAPPDLAANCHCRDCRKFFAAGHNTIAIFPADAVTVEGRLAEYTVTAESGHTITRRFCVTCGSATCAEGPGFPGKMMVPLAVLDDAEAHAIRPVASVFTRSAAAWDPPLAGIPAFEASPPARG